VTGLRALGRVAVRDARRDRWRTLLVVLIVALPVAGLGGIISLVDTLTATPAERVIDLMGRADLLAEPDRDLLGGVDPLVDLAGRLPAASVLEPTSRATDEVVLPGSRPVATLADTSLDPQALAAGRYRLLEGRAPAPATAAGTTEVAVTREVARWLDVGVGDVVSLAARGEARIVGVVLRPEALSERRVLVAPGTLGSEAILEQVLVALPAGVTTADLGLDGWHTRDSASFPGTDAPPWWLSVREAELQVRFPGGHRSLAVIGGGLAIVEVALVAGAAFAVSVRRRQRELGLVAAVGGTERQVRRLVLLTGATAGALGATLGTLLGVLGVLAARPWYEVLAGREVTALRLDPWWLLGVALLGTAASVIGAWLPARSVARLPVTVALSGRRPAPQPSARGLRLGLVLLVVGALVTVLAAATLVTSAGPGTYVFLAGAVLVVLGAGLTSPWLLEQLGRLAPRLPAGPRLAVRDAARFRTRNGPIVTAAMAGLAATVTITAVVGSVDTAAARSYEPSLAPDQLLVHAGDDPRPAGQGHDAAGRAVAATLGGRSASLVHLPLGLELLPRREGETVQLWDLALGTEDLALALGGETAVDALARGEVVVLGPADPGGGAVEGATLFRWEDDGNDELREVAVATVGVTALPADAANTTEWSQVPRVLVPPQLVADLPETQDAELAAWSTLVVIDAPLDDAGFAVASRVADETVPGSWVQGELGYRSDAATLLAVVTVAGGLAGLALVAVAIALAAAEARSDLRTLTAVGASAATRRSLAAGRAALLAGLGALLAVPVGLVPAGAILLRVSDVALVPPWVALGVVVILVPALATLGSIVLASRAPTPSVRLVG
jgi:putative ABC transport system permease protein